MSPKILAIGDLTVDQIMGPLSSLPGWGEEGEVRSLEIRLGGNTGNFALTAKALGLDIVCMGSIGDDGNGAWIRAELEAHGLTTNHLQVHDDLGTSVSVALVKDDGERLFVTYPGALGRLGDVVAGGGFPDASHALFSGWCQPPRVAATTLAERFDALRARGTKVVIDLAWSDASWKIRDDLFEALKRADIIIMNSDEAAALTRQSDLRAAMEHLRYHLGPEATVIVKCGADGALLSAPYLAVTSVPALLVKRPLPAVGTGDGFNAGFLHALAVQKLQPVDAVQFGCDVASWQLANGRQKQVDAAAIRALRAGEVTREGALT